jgi:DNA-directed RNA polymerase subunit RPC12/RpoP
MESDLFGDAEFPIKCQACGNATQIKVSDLEKNPEVVCPKCGLTTKIEADELKKMRETINQAAEKFKMRFGVAVNDVFGSSCAVTAL